MRFRMGLICWYFFFCVQLHSQDSFVINVDSNTYLTDVLSEFSQKHDVLFAYPSLLLKDVKLSQQSIQYHNVDGFLNHVLPVDKFELFNLNNKQFLIRKRNVSSIDHLTLSGSLYDFNTKEKLPFASIYTDDFSIGVLTDEDGNYSFDCPSNLKSDLIISYLGYEQKRMTLKSFQASNEIALKHQANVIQEIEINYIIPPFMIEKESGSIRFADKVLSLNSSGIYGTDLIRNVQLLPGVSAHEDDSASLKIRGSNSEDSQIIIDGIPVYNASHYYNIFSAINSEFVDEAKLYKNHQPLQFKTNGGGLLDLSSGGIKSKSENKVNLNLLTASASFDNQIGSNMRLKVAARTSYRNVNDSRLLDLGGDSGQQFTLDNDRDAFITNDPRFKFVDINYSLKYRKKNFGFSLNGINSKDVFDNSYELNIELGQSTLKRNLYQNYEDWTNEGFSFNADYRFNSKWIMYATIYGAQHRFNSNLNSRIQGEQLNNLITSKNAGSLLDDGLKLFANFQGNTHKFEFGLDVNKYEIRQRLTYEDDQIAVDYKDNVILNTLFFNFEKQWGKFKYDIGFRSPTAKQEGRFKSLFSPQLSGIYSLTDNKSLKFSYSFSNQILRELEYETRLGQNLKFFGLSNGSTPVLRTNKFMLGYSVTSGDFNVDVEFFTKKMDGVMQLTYLQAGFDESGNSLGTGGYKNFIGERRVNGLDVMVSYSKKNYISWLAYTLSKSEDRFPQLFRGNFFLSQNDRRHQLKWINQWKLKKFDFSFNMIYSSGRPYLAFESLNELIDKESLNLKDNQRMLPSYIRYDIGFNYNFNIVGTKARVGCTIFNLFNRQNVKYIQYSYRLVQQNSTGPNSFILGTQGDLLDRTLNLNFEVYF